MLCRTLDTIRISMNMKQRAVYSPLILFAPLVLLVAQSSKVQVMVTQQAMTKAIKTTK